jgi:hypothetical protein
MSRIAIISDGSDGTAQYFSTFLTSAGCTVYRFYWEEFASSTAYSLHRLIERLNQVEGLYVREPPRFDYYD